MDYPKLYPIMGFNAHGAFNTWWIHRYHYGRKEVLRYTYPYNPKTEPQQAWRTVFGQAVANWQAMTDEQKLPYNEWVINKPLSGYNRYISLYLKANQ